MTFIKVNAEQRISPLGSLCDADGFRMRYLPSILDQFLKRTYMKLERQDLKTYMLVKRYFSVGKKGLIIMAQHRPHPCMCKNSQEREKSS